MLLMVMFVCFHMHLMLCTLHAHVLMCKGLNYMPQNIEKNAVTV